MIRMITLGLTAAALAAIPGAQAAELTPQKVAKIAKRVFRTEIRSFEPAPGSDSSVEHAGTANYSSTAGHALTAGQATTADRAATAESAITAVTATTAEVADAAVAANPMAYALVRKDGFVDPARAFGITHGDIRSADGDYCFSRLRPKGIQVTVEYTGTYSYFGPSLHYPVVVAALGAGDNCPAGTEFYVRAFNSTDGQKGFASFFVSLVM